jgi:cytidylate kinase
MIVTIDGPAGAGKSTVARELARRLAFEYLDTGAMYRAVTWEALLRGLDLSDGAAIAELARSLDLQFKSDRIFIGQRDVTTAIRQPEVTAAVSTVADLVPVRRQLVERQRRIASTGRFVCEGRDQGTVAFPDALAKIYLTASVARRAERRREELRAAGHAVSQEDVERQQLDRDRRDEDRPEGALRKAPDAIEINTDDLKFEEVVDKLEAIVRERLTNQCQ